MSQKADDPLKNLANMFKNAEPTNKNVPNRFRLLYKHATTTMAVSGVSIEIPCDIEVFGFEKRIFILHENLISLLEFDQIGQAVISTYMS